MKTTILLISLIAFLVVSRESWGSDYTGIWKGECSDYYGIQIKPTEKDLYSVSFCGLRGCFAPGEWSPNTRIEGDPEYKIISPTELGIKRKDKDEFFIYKKCTDDPIWTVADTPKPRQLPDCPFAAPTKEKGVLIGWTTDIRETTRFGPDIKTQTTKVGSFRPLALLNGATLKETQGNTIFKGQSFWPVLSPSSKPVKLTSVNSLFDVMNEGQCVYFGDFGKIAPPRWILLSSKPIPGLFRAPTRKDTEEFYRLNTTCVRQGDHPEGQEPPCVRPKLLAVTDFNKNGKPEYWATEPYLWDTGLIVWENNNGLLIPLLQVCVGCSD